MTADSMKRIFPLLCPVLFFLIMPLPVSSSVLKQAQEPAVLAGWGSTDVRYPRESASVRECPLTQALSMRVWRGESVPAQAVVCTGAGHSIDSLSVSLADLPESFAVRAGFVGYLRWAFNSWPGDPMHDSRFTAWAAGDTYLVYPGGLSSIRFERLKAGITAYRKIMALREEFIRTGNKAGMARLEKALSLFVLPDADALRRQVIDRDMPDMASDAVNAAKKILDRL